MILLGPYNNLNLTDSQATSYFHTYAQDYIRSTAFIPNKKLQSIEKYLKINCDLKPSLYDLLKLIIQNTYLTLNGDKFTVVINNDIKSSIINISLDQAARLITYGNLEFEGYPIILEAYKYACYQF
jgi:hypothetical protein